MKKILYFLLFILPLGSFSQTWIISQHLKCDDDLRIYDIKKDINDDFYIAGIFKGTFEGNISEGFFDIFIAKLNSNFNLEWIQTAGSSSIEFDPRIIIDKENNIFLLGAFRDSCVFENQYLKSDGNYDVFLAKYSSGGKLNWAKKIANYPSQQSPTDIDVDNDNNLIITGHYTDSIFIYDEKIVSPGKNNFYAKFDTSGAKLWVKNISGSSTGSRFANVKVYQNEYYFNGYFRDDMNFDLKTITSNVAGKQDLFLYKTDINGDGIWIRRTYGDDIDVTGSITGDNYGNVYFTGYFQSSTLSADSTETVLANQVLNHVNDFDIFILKYNKSGTLQLNKHFGKNGRDYGIDLNVNNDILYMSGYYSDTIVFGNDTLSSTGTSDRDMFLTSFDLNANPYNSISLGGTDGDDIAAGAIVLNSGEAVMGGYFQSTTLTVGDSTYTNGGVFDGIIAKYYAPLSTAFTKITNPTCNSQSNGELIITPIFGEMPYTYTWSHDGGLTDSTATGLSAGFYSVTVTDALDSTDVAQYTLTEPGAFLFNPVITQITSCSYSQEGAINLNVTGGNGGNTYQWAQSDGGNGVVLTAKDQSGLAIGTYSVTVTDTESCTGDTVIYITGPDPITFGGSVVTDSSGIESGAIDLVCSGGSGDPASFTFNWQGPTGPPTHSEDTSNLSPGNYSVTVTDVNVCEFDTMFNVANLDTFYIYISDYKDACNNTFNGNATVSYSSPHGHTAITYLWDANTGSQTTAQATGLASGRYYYVTVTDTENTPNTVLVDSVYIDELSYIFAGSLAGTTTLDCYGDTDGYIDLSITTEGELPYTYNWSNSETTQDITNLAIGTYSVTATDANECTFSITDYVIDQPTALAAVAEIVNNPTCNGDLDGEVTVLRNGGTVPYTYQWNDQGSQTTQNADGLDAGYYTVTVTDFNSCTAVSSINLTEPEQIIIDTTVNHLSCNSDADGSIQLSVSGGTVPFTYFWSTTNGSGLVVTDKNQSGLTAGKYYFTATDDHNCTYEDSVEITEPLLLEITNEEKTDVTTCNGDNTGTITITANGGTGVLTYILNPGAIQTNSTGAFTGISAGTYTVDVDDENSCGPVTSSSIEIAEPGLISITAETPTDISCNGLTDGQIVIAASGGTGTLQYSIDNGTIYQASSTFSGLAQGTNYQVKVQDANLCETSGSTLTITEPGQISITAETPTDISCNGLTDGQIVIAASGGTGTLQYSIDNGTIYQASDTFSDLAQGTNYQVKVQDANLCETSGSTLTITEPGQISITAETPTDISCNGLTDGQIVIAASGGTGTLQYSIDNGTIYQTSGTFSGLAQGTNYQVKVQDANLCETSGSTLTINEPAVINLESSDAVNPTCNGDSDGSIDITISGGTVATVYTYSWSTTDGSGLVTDSEDQTGLSAGTYNVTATDDNSCASAFVITLDDPLEISIDSENSTDASSQTTADGTITVTASGGTGILTYDLNPGDDSNITGIYNSLLPGDYTVDVTDDNSCGPVSSNTITVGYPNAIDDIIISDKIKLYPNPTSAKLNVEIDFEIDDVYKIEILSISGQILFNKEIKSHGITKEELDLSNYPKGVYFIRIYNSQFNFKEKILLQ